jgi:oligopeptide transport system permease protein
MKKWLNSWPTRASFTFLVLISLVALMAPWIARFPYELQDIDNVFQIPSLLHWFGTDALGRDLWSRVLFGARISLSIAILTAFSSVLIGSLLGTLAGFWEGWFDRLLMRTIDVLYTLPTLVIMILVMLVMGRGLTGVFVALTLTGWLGTARLMRAQVLTWKKRPFVEAAHALGVSPMRLLWKHILPHCMAPLIVDLSYQIPSNILAEAFLSFLGIGIAPPLPSWGVLVDEGFRALNLFPHLVITPGFAIFLTMLSFNILGDRLRDHLDPFLKNR